MKRTIGTIVVVIVFFAVDIAFALTGVTTAPTSGAGFDFYDLIVNKIIQGPIGMTGAVGGIAWGSSQLFRSNLVGGLLPIVGGTGVLLSEDILTSFGALIP